MSPDTRRRSPALAGEIDPGVHVFLDCLKATRASGVAPAPDRALSADLREVGVGENLAELFAARAAVSGCQLHRAATTGASALAAALLATLGVRSAVLEPRADTFLTPDSMDEWLTALRRRGITAVTDRVDETLFEVGAAITGVELAIAETGTLVCASGPDRARGTSLIPPVHVAVVDSSQIVPDLFDAFERLSTIELPANVNLITGPSKTADIEGVLVTGVHGPGSVHILLVSTG